MRTEGEKYRPIVKVLKTRNGVPTKVFISGQEYVLEPEHEKLKRDYINTSRKLKEYKELVKLLNGRLGRKGNKRVTKRTS